MYTKLHDVSVFQYGYHSTVVCRWKKTLKIDQYLLATAWTKICGLLFLGHPIFRMFGVVSDGESVAVGDDSGHVYVLGVVETSVDDTCQLCLDVVADWQVRTDRWSISRSIRRSCFHSFIRSLMSLLIHSFTQQPSLFDTTRQILFTFRSRKRNKYKIISFKATSGRLPNSNCPQCWPPVASSLHGKNVS